MKTALFSYRKTCIISYWRICVYVYIRIYSGPFPRIAQLLTKPCLYFPIIIFFRSCLQSVARPHEHADSTYIKCAPTYKYPTLNSFWYRSKVVTTVPLCLLFQVQNALTKKIEAKFVGHVEKNWLLERKRLVTFD